ncbi:MAG: ATP-binding protein [Vulcanimicrobiaceae bacterium]
MDSGDAVLGLRIPPEPARACAARRSVGAFARAHGLAPADLDHFLTALGEAVANAIEHARTSGEIAIEVRINEARIVALVRDDGVGFPDGLAARAKLPADDAERGRGLPIIRRCSDIFTLRSRPGRGTALVFGRYRSGCSQVVA